jgi:2-pyrone-4,6-dicarboxylate lactonase
MTDILQCTPMRVAETNTPPAFAMPPGACDTHFHVFEHGYPHVPDPLYTFPDGTLDAYLRMTEVLGIEHMILVQPSFYGTDNSLLTDWAPQEADRRTMLVDGPDRLFFR